MFAYMKLCRDESNSDVYEYIHIYIPKLKIKEALHIMWERPNLNKQLQDYNVLLSFSFHSLLLLSVFFTINIFDS